MSEGTQKTIIPRFIEPRRFANLGVDLSGSVSVDQLTRLLDADVEPLAVNANLSFSRGDSGERKVTGQVLASVSLVCQRCLERVQKQLECNVNLAVVWNEEKAKELPKSLEPWVVVEDEADLYQMVEEEIFLNLPVVAFHSSDCVDKTLLSSDDGKDDGRDSADTNNPFQMLEQLKGKIEK